MLSDWGIEKAQAGQLDAKLTALSKAEVDPTTGKVKLPTGLVAGPHVWGQKWIYKLRINGRVALRPMFCLGPIKNADEWTFLARAREVGNDTTEQKAAAATAASRRTEVMQSVRKRQKYPSDWNNDGDNK